MSARCVPRCQRSLAATQRFHIFTHDLPIDYQHFNTRNHSLQRAFWGRPRSPFVVSGKAIFTSDGAARKSSCICGQGRRDPEAPCFALVIPTLLPGYSLLINLQSDFCLLVERMGLGINSNRQRNDGLPWDDTLMDRSFGSCFTFLSLFGLVTGRPAHTRFSAVAWAITFHGGFFHHP